jgi:retron-type reverse transcriptase
VAQINGDERRAVDWSGPVRRARNLWPHVASFGNLCRAARRASRGKRHRPSVACFLEQLEPRALALHRALEDGSWQPGTLRAFRITDPKPRTIQVAPFADRVVHHALIGPLEPVLERGMLDCSFACREGKGQHAALAAARGMVRRYRYALTLDVLHHFESTRHDVVMTTLARRIKDRRVLDLCAKVLRAVPGGLGLPIGSLTSQWFANTVLDRLDHHVKETLRIPGYLRYMDDMVLLADDKATLKTAAHEVACYLADPLRLTLKTAATRLIHSADGLPWLGWRILPGMTRLRPASLRRTRRRLATLREMAARGELDEERLADAERAIAAHLSSGSTLQLRRQLAQTR